MPALRTDAAAAALVQLYDELDTQRHAHPPEAMAAESTA